MSKKENISDYVEIAFFIVGFIFILASCTKLGIDTYSNYEKCRHIDCEVSVQENSPLYMPNPSVPTMHWFLNRP